MLLYDGKSFFRSQKDHKLIYLLASIALELWLVIHFQHQNSICRVTGDKATSHNSAIMELLWEKLLSLFPLTSSIL